MRTYWNDAEKKKARERMVKEPIARFFGGGLPPHKDYVALCGESNEIRTPLKRQGLIWGCEVQYVCCAAKIAPYERFYGIDKNSDVIEANAALSLPVHWICGDFSSTVVSLVKMGKADPGFINCDMMTTPPKACPYAAKMMRQLSGISNALFAVNMILKHRAFDFKRDDVEAWMLNLEDFQRSGWEHFPVPKTDDVYRSADKGAALMFMMLFSKP
jgi:hypothetical protein